MAVLNLMVSFLGSEEGARNVIGLRIAGPRVLLDPKTGSVASLTPVFSQLACKADLAMAAHLADVLRVQVCNSRLGELRSGRAPKLGC